MKKNQWMWYGVSCTYWTDDWDKVPAGGPNNMIPCCPQCGSFGFQAKVEAWWKGAEEHEKRDHPGYVKWLEESKETCVPDGDFKKLYAAWKDSQDASEQREGDEVH